VLGHRGARRRAAENTSAAFDLAMSEGADGVELDVRLDRDGDVVVIHDADLARVTDGRDSRRVEELGRRELESIDVGGSERVPRLEDVLDWARRYAARVNVELKRDVSRRALLVWKVARLIRRDPKAGERIVISSFDPLLVAAAARLLPSVPAGWLVEGRRPMPGRSPLEKLVGAKAVHPHSSLVTADSIAPWQRDGLLVNVWTVNDVAEARRLAALGVDTIITDEPARILAGLQSETDR
jgi:glycerophosphoryl diester phosphodiesterase